LEFSNLQVPPQDRGIGRGIPKNKKLRSARKVTAKYIQLSDRFTWKGGVLGVKAGPSEQSPVVSTLRILNLNEGREVRWHVVSQWRTSALRCTNNSALGQRGGSLVMLSTENSNGNKIRAYDLKLSRRLHSLRAETPRPSDGHVYIPCARLKRR